MRTLTGRVAVVTGVTSGIGRVLARDLFAAGAAVVGCARDGQRLDVVAAELPGLIAVRCDLRESADRAALVRAALDRFGRVDVLVHNAGLGFVGAVADMTAEDVERIIDTNVTAFIDLARRHATCSYSCRRPPSRSRRSGRRLAFMGVGGGVRPVGGC
jgi:NAD(P)-dependent dehydrogenase (short-subunit alcohol dehydrogenase family)